MIVFKCSALFEEARNSFSGFGVDLFKSSFDFPHTTLPSYSMLKLYVFVGFPQDLHVTIATIAKNFSF